MSFVLFFLLNGCGRTEPAAPVFLRDGYLVASGQGEGRPVGGDRVLVQPGPAPGSSVEVGGGIWPVPQHPACVALFSVPLGDLSRWIGMGAEPPDTALAFDPAGDRLAIGTWDGDLRIVDGWTGEALGQLHLAETMVKRVAWSPDGSVLYAAEQSPDARVVAVDPANMAVTASIRLADHVEGSPPPPGDDLYGVYTLPAAYALVVGSDGDLVVVATHGWNDPDGVRQNRARVLRLGPDLTVKAAWPSEGAADAVALSASVSGDRVAVGLSRSAEGPAPDGLPVDGVQLLDRSGLEAVGQVVLPPLAPWFHRSFIWEALALGPDGSVGFGLGDGRVAWWRRGAEPVVHGLGTPIEVGEVAIASSVGHLVRSGDTLYALTAGTNIPFGTARPELRPPQAHPNENALFALRPSADGWEQGWTWRGPQHLQGLTLSPDGQTLVVGAGARSSDDREDLFGALVFELDGTPQPLVCATEGPVFFRQAVADDGRIAVAEHPWKSGDEVRGTYRVTVLR